MSLRRQARTCGQCHEKEALEYLSSSHGRAASRGIHEAPVCSDCHGEHVVLPSTDPRSPTHRLQIGQSLCLGCHDRPAIQAKFGMAGKRGITYKDSVHGLAVRGRSTTAAVCTDCHGVHGILPASDTMSSIHLSRRTQTCGRCHENATPAFAAGVPIHGSYQDHAATNIVRLFYRFLITATLGGMSLWIVALMSPVLRRRMKSMADRVRFTRFEMVQHAVLVVSFTILAVTGFALAFPEAAWVRGLAWLGLSDHLRGLAHRVAGVVMVVSSIVHVVYLGFNPRGRWAFRKLFPSPGDIRDARDHLLYALGRRASHPNFGHFSYFEKMEYWALVWGTAIMALTGFILWFPETLPRIVATVSEAIHFYEAVLAVGAILIWHSFFVIFDPEIYPLNMSMFSGRATKGSELEDRTETPEAATLSPSSKNGDSAPEIQIS